MIGVHTIKYVNDHAYVVKQEVSISRFEVKGSNRLNMELVQAYRDWMGCDHVLRSQTHFMFCETIEEAVMDWELS
jgi:hypothetical protein|tara:strand:- start:89 stop:313 length:225 start_codon:yes stop_codon:yes gene_type:complete